jgi:UDP-N-acetylglucosamine--N-acetylmuramyl-(pentapeptide) pyrophosphoryl-undecaprenol N-acetylglucosamine transferase
MKILFAGGGSGGHFYPIIAVAQEINIIAKEEHLLEAKLYFMAPDPYDRRALFENNIEFVANPAGKLRRYFSLLNIMDGFKTFIGILKSIVMIFSIYPDIIFGKGGYASFPALIAAKIFSIPVVIHESDTIPGKVNLWASKFASRIAISYPEAADFFPKDKTAQTGNPIRRELRTISPEGAHEFFKLDPVVPTILILGGSQGAATMNDILLDSLKDLLSRYQIIHQTGPANIKEVSKTSSLLLENGPYKNRYRPFDTLNNLAMKMAAGVAELVISRAGSTIFEIALWGKPSIIVPIPTSVSHNQRSNAFAYSRTGACVVLEEENLSPHVFTAEVDRIMADESLRKRMRESAKNFASPDAADKIAREIIRIGLSHER